MHGKFTTTLRDFALEYAKKLKYQNEEEESHMEEEGFQRYGDDKEFSRRAKS